MRMKNWIHNSLNSKSIPAKWTWIKEPIPVLFWEWIFKKMTRSCFLLPCFSFRVRWQTKLRSPVLHRRCSRWQWWGWPRNPWQLRWRYRPGQPARRESKKEKKRLYWVLTDHFLTRFELGSDWPWLRRAGGTGRSSTPWKWPDRPGKMARVAADRRWTGSAPRPMTAPRAAQH